MQLGTKRDYKAVEEKLLGFVVVYKLACTELHGSDSLVKCVSGFCVKIRLLMFKMFLLFTSSFLSWIQPKKVEGQTFFGFVLLI